MLSLSLPAADKIRYFAHSILQLINSISNDLQKLLKYFNDTAIVTFFSIPFKLSASVFPNNLILH